ncbi:hypothetical protein D1872_294570 [compost metagenome]
MCLEKARLICGLSIVWELNRYNRRRIYAVGPRDSIRRRNELTMNKVVYQAPTGSEQVLQNLVELERIILDGFPDYWHDGHGGGML